MQGPTSHFEHVKINSVIAKGNIQYGILVLWESILSCEPRLGLFSRCLLHMNGMQVAMARCGGEESWNKRFSDVKQNFGSIQEINFRSVLNNSNFAFFSKEPLPKITFTTPGSIISDRVVVNRPTIGQGEVWNLERAFVRRTGFHSDSYHWRA